MIGEYTKLTQCKHEVIYRTLTIHLVQRPPFQVSLDTAPVVFLQALRKVHLPDQCRQHMALLQVEIIVRPIKIGGHHGNKIGAVLDIEALAHLEPGNLGDGIGLVGILQRRSKERLLLHWLWRFLGIDATTTQEQQFFHPMPETLADHVILYLQILIYKVSPVGVISHDTTHEGRREDHVLGFLLLEEFFNGYSI